MVNKSGGDGGCQGEHELAVTLTANKSNFLLDYMWRSIDIK